MFERFTDRARRVVVLAQEEARMLEHNYIGTEHLLLGLISEGSGVGAKALEALGVELERARGAIEGIIGKGAGDVPAGHIPFTPRAKKVMELSLREALQLGHNYIGTEHILLGLVREQEGVGAQVLTRAGVTIGDVRAKVLELLQGFTSTPPVGVAAPPPEAERYSPGLRAALDAAIAHAAGAITVGTQHVLSVFAERTDLAASNALLAGGFDVANLTVPIAQWSVANTLDETPAQWGMRVTDIEATDDAVLIALRDEELQARIKSAIAGGNGPAVQAMIGDALKELASKLPPADPPAEGEKPGAAEG